MQTDPSLRAAVASATDETLNALIAVFLFDHTGYEGRREDGSTYRYLIRPGNVDLERAREGARDWPREVPWTEVEPEYRDGHMKYASTTAGETSVIAAMASRGYGCTRRHVPGPEDGLSDFTRFFPLHTPSDPPTDLGEAWGRDSPHATASAAVLALAPSLPAEALVLLSPQTDDR